MSRDLDTTRYSRGQTQDGGSARNIVLGIDIGGTFTDFVAYDKDAKTAIAWKYFSNAEDPATGIFDGLKEFQKALFLRFRRQRPLGAVDKKLTGVGVVRELHYFG